MLEKNIVFWGCGKIAQDFFTKYENQIKVNFAVSNNSKEHTFEPKKDVFFEVKRPDIKSNFGKDLFIVICSERYNEIAEQLIFLGYEPFVDFMDWELASVILDTRKIVLLYGFCHLRGIRDCLAHSEQFNEQYCAIYVANYLALNEYGQRRLGFLLKKCSVYIYGVEIEPQHNRINTAILKGLNKQVLRLAVPAIIFGGYFPQKKRLFNALNQYAIKLENQPYTPFSYGDSFLNECIQNNLSLSDIISQIKNKNIFDKDFLSKYIENEWKIMKFQERQSNFEIVEYIYDNYKKTRLFRNEAHMENPVLYRYVEQIFGRLGLNEEPLIINSRLLNCSQHFIYPEVADFLGLEWDVWNEELELYTYAGWKKIKMPQFIEEYYYACKNIKELKEKGYMV